MVVLFVSKDLPTGWHPAVEAEKSAAIAPVASVYLRPAWDQAWEVDKKAVVAVLVASGYRQIGRHRLGMDRRLGALASEYLPAG